MPTKLCGKAMPQNVLSCESGLYGQGEGENDVCVVGKRNAS